MTVWLNFITDFPFLILINIFTTALTTLAGFMTLAACLTFEAWKSLQQRTETLSFMRCRAVSKAISARNVRYNSEDVIFVRE